MNQFLSSTATEKLAALVTESYIEKLASFEVTLNEAPESIQAEIKILR